MIAAAPPRIAAASGPHDRNHRLARVPFAAEIVMPASFRFAQEQSFKLRLLGFQIRILAPIQSFLEIHPIHQQGMNQIGDFITHWNTFWEV